MSRYLSLAVLGFAGFSMAAPQVSQAQPPVGVQVQVGPVGFNYQQGYSYVAPPCTVPPAPVVVARPVVIATPTPIYAGWRWDGHRWYRHERFDHYRGYHR